MAEGGWNQDENVQYLTSEPESESHFFCERCTLDHRYVPARGYCHECGEHMCTDCTVAHREYPATSHHDVQDQAAMPENTSEFQDQATSHYDVQDQASMPEKSSESLNPISEDMATCVQQNEENEHNSCQSQDAIEFNTKSCVETVHKEYDTTASVDEQSETIIGSHGHDEFSNHLHDMGQRSRDMIDRTREYVTAVEKIGSGAITNIRKQKEEFIAMFDEHEEQLITQVETVSSENRADLERVEKELHDVTKAVDDLKIEFDDLVKSKCDKQLQIRMKGKQNEASSLEDMLEATEKSINVRSFQFEPNNDINDALGTSGLGKIVHLDSLPGHQDATLAKNGKKTRVELVTNIDVHVRYDECGRRSISGLAVLSDNVLVIADYYNKMVKLVDTKSNKLSFLKRQPRLKIEGHPFDVAKILDDQVAASIENAGKILIIKVNNVTDSLSVERELSVSSDCRGVAYTHGKLLVAFIESRRIDVMDLQGNIITTLEKGIDGNKLFYSPRHICVSSDGEDIYVTDNYANRVLRLTFGGEIKSEFSGTKLQGTVCTDHCGNVYVAPFYHMAIYMLSADCKKIKTLVTAADGLDGVVKSVSHCASTNRLYLGMNTQKSIKVYQLV